MIRTNSHSLTLGPEHPNAVLTGAPHALDLICRTPSVAADWSKQHSLQHSEEELLAVHVVFGQANWTVVLYRSAKELTDRWNELDRREAHPGQGVVFGLSTEFQGHLPALIRRDSFGPLLVLNYLPDCPATVRRFLPDDLPAADLGWSEVRVVESFETLCEASGEEQSWLIFWPYDLVTDQIRDYATPRRMM